MALNDVKEITVPVNGIDKAVRKIEDSNGNIIWGSQSAFPYRLLDYIQSDGTGQYIDTPFKTNNTRIFDVVMSFQYTNTNTWNPIFGFRTAQSGWATANNAVVIGQKGISTTQLQFALNYANKESGYLTSHNFSFDTKLTMTFNLISKRFDVNGTNITTLSTNTLVEAPHTPYVGTVYYANGFKDTRYCKYKLYQYFVRNNSYQRIANLYPVQRKSDGALGMYDIIGNTFYPNVGSGSFTAGPIVDEYWDLTAPA